jgi:selenocysteine-specific elongation factor
VKDLYYPSRTVERAAALARRIAAAHDDRSLSVAEFRDASGLGRKRALQIVEFLDRAGLLRRVGDRHRLRPDAAPFGEGGAS